MYYHLLYTTRKLSTHYKKEGVTILKGADRFLIGNSGEFEIYDKICVESTVPVDNPINWLVQRQLSDNGVYDSKKDKALLWSVMNVQVLGIVDPDMVQDIFVTKNKLVDKTGVMQQAMEDMAPSAFIFQKGDDSWSQKRKACAHAFYKERLEKMMCVLKEKLNQWVERHNAEIDASEDQQTVVDLASTFEKLFCSNIVHICFGEDVSDMTIEIDVPEHRMSWNWSRKTMTLSEAINAFSQ